MMKLRIFFILVVSYVLGNEVLEASAQSKIFTIAGNGMNGFTGDGGPASYARLSSPYGIAMREDGFLYILDHGNHCIRGVDSFGSISTVAGIGAAGFSGDGGPAKNAVLNRPYGMCLDPAGNLYIADTFNHRIRKVDTNGLITTVAGNGESGFSGDGGSATLARLNLPFGVYADAHGNLYLADTGNHRIRVVSRTGMITTVAGDGEVGYTGDGSPALKARLNNPLSVFADPSGTIYITDAGSHVIRKVSNLGLIFTVAGNGVAGYTGDGASAGQANLRTPSDMALDSTGNLYIADTGNNVIRMITPKGIISTVAGTGQDGYGGDGGIPSQSLFSSPIRLCMTPQDDLYIADLRNHRIRLITTSLPLAIHAGEDRVTFVDESTSLHARVEGGSGTYQYRWTIQSGPSTDRQQFSSTTTLDPVFVPSKSGVYVLALEVDDQVRPPRGDTVTVLVFNPIPIGSLIVCDTLLTGDDLSQGIDTDSEDRRDLVIRWNMDQALVNLNDISDFNVFVSVDGSDYDYLGGTGDGTLSLLEWKPTQSDKFNPRFQEGPQFGHSYQFRLFVSTRSGNPIYYGPFDTSGAVLFKEDSEPTPLPDTPTFFSSPSPTSTLFTTPVVPTPTIPRTPSPGVTPTNTSNPTILPTYTPVQTPYPTSPQPTNTGTVTPTWTLIPTGQPSPTSYPLETKTPTLFVTPTQTITGTITPYATPTPGTIPTATRKPDATFTHTPIPVATSTPTGTYQSEATYTPTWTSTITPTPTTTPVPGIPQIRIEPLNLNFTRVSSSSVDSAKQHASHPMHSSPENPDWRILLRSGDIDPETGSSRVNQPASTVSKTPFHYKHKLIQFSHILTRNEIEELGQEGIRVLRYIPHFAYWVGVDDPASLSQIPFANNEKAIHWMADSKQVNRLSPEAAAGLFPPNAWLEDGRVQVLAIIFSDVEKMEAERSVMQAGGEVLDWLDPSRMQVVIHFENLNRLAQLDIVEWVEPVPSPNEPVNVTASQRIHATELRNPPYSLNGKNIVVGVWDGGQVYVHPDFGSRLTIVDTDLPVHYHATHVAGTIGGNAIGQASALGMVPNVLLRSYDWNYDSSEMRSAFASGVRLSNHSYGEVVGYFWNSSKNGWDYWPNTYRFGMYTSSDMEFDQVVYDTGLLVFKAAGNDRGEGDGPYDCIPPRGVAKNVITIGATSDSDAMTSFSSWGPVDDGRVKPDLCANGEGLYSTMPNGDYASLSGTSMASPSACGGGALLFQLFQNELGMNPRPETLKALMIHGAKDLGRTGPDFCYGWGLLDTKSSADLLIDRMWREGTISQGMKVPYTAIVPHGSARLKVTLVWTDPPSSPSAAKSLVNDLDLVLRSPSGTVYYPWVLDKNNPTTDASTGINRVDNVEQVLVTTPLTGIWTIEIQGTTIAQGPGNFTVVSESFANLDNSQSFQIFNDGDGSLNVTSMNVPDGAWVQFTPQAPFLIAPGQSQKVNVWINYDQSPYGASTRQIVVSSNDPALNPYPDGVFVHIDNNVTPTPIPTGTQVPTGIPSPTPTSTATPAPSYPIIQIDPLTLDVVYSGRVIGLNEIASVSSRKTGERNMMDSIPMAEFPVQFEDSPSGNTLPDGRILVWIFFDPETDLPSLRSQIESRGDRVLSLLPEGYLLVAIFPENWVSLSSTEGVEGMTPAPIRTDSITEIPPLDHPYLGANLPSQEEQVILEQRFTETDAVDANDLSILRASLEGQAQLPTSVDNTLSQYFPPIRSQGSQGSCTCWAACYYYNTFTQAHDEGYNVSQGNNDYICSPGFMYPLVNGGGDYGAYTAYVVSRLSEIGCASWSAKPYSSSDYSSWPTEQAWLGALKNRTQSNKQIYVNNDTTLMALKQHLANGNLAVTQTPVYTNWYYWQDNQGKGIQNGVLFSHTGASLVGYHAMTVVGFDDNRSYYDGSQTRYGAFLIANSWGQWGTYNSLGSGSRGFMWVSYDYFKSVFNYAWYNEDRADYRPRLYAATGMNHANRIQIGYRGGIGNLLSTLWQSPRTLDQTYMKPASSPAYTLASGNRVVVDLTDGIDSISDLGNIELYVESVLPGASNQPVNGAEFFHDLDSDGNFESVAVSPSNIVAHGDTWRSTVQFSTVNNRSRFIISNLGGSTLSIASMELDQVDSAISWTPQAPFDISPGSSQEVSVSVDWDQLPLGFYTRKLGVYSNDSANSPYPGGVYITVNKDVNPTPTPTSTNTFIPTLTWTPSRTPTSTNTPREISTTTPPPPVPTSTPTRFIPEPTKTSTWVNPTATISPTMTQTPLKPTIAPTATSTPSATPTQAMEPTATPTEIGILRNEYRFEPASETLESLGFTRGRENARIQVTSIPIDSNSMDATNGVGLKILVSPGELVTINGPQIEVRSQPLRLSEWLSVTRNEIQAAMGVYAMRDGQAGPVAYTWMSSPDLSANQWRQALIEIEAGYTTIVPFLALYNPGTLDNIVYVDNLFIVQGETGTVESQIDLEPWQANLWLSTTESGYAYQEGETLILEKEQGKNACRFGSVFYPPVYPYSVEAEIEVVKAEGSTGALTLWVGNGPKSIRCDLPLWMMPSGVPMSIRVAGTFTQDVGPMLVIIQIAGEEREKVIVNSVRVNHRK